MKHYIIVKFKNKVNIGELVEPIKKLFNNALEIEGISNIEVYRTNTDLSNRYHLMIEMTLSEKALIEFDNSQIHKQWKTEYGNLIEDKTIFDCD